jgi:hypothetical protein
MKKWLCTVVVLITLSGIAHARYRPNDDEEDSPPPPAGTAPTATAPGSGTADGARIYTWEENGVLHAVSNPSDIPPRYSKRAESAEANPLIIRMVPETPPPPNPAGTAQRGKKASTRKHAPSHRKKPPAAVRDK